MICRWTPAVVGIALITLAGCARKQNEAGAAAPAPLQPPAATSELSSGPATEPTQSSLAIKRGVVTAEGDHVMFQSCDDKTPLWVIDESAGAVTELLTEDATAAYVEVYGERAPVPDDVPAARGQAGVSFSSSSCTPAFRVKPAAATSRRRTTSLRRAATSRSGRCR